MQGIYALLAKLRHCVLTTTSGNRPHCSLMAYVMDAEKDEVFMLTRTTSKKYQNIKQFPYVSLLFDTRELMDCGDARKVEALTVEGESLPVYDEDAPRIKERLVAADARLASLAGDPDCVVLRVKLKQFLHAKDVDLSRYIA